MPAPCRLCPLLSPGTSVRGGPVLIREIDRRSSPRRTSISDGDRPAGKGQLSDTFTGT
jgi:hypothetical protein